MNLWCLQALMAYITCSVLTVPVWHVDKLCIWAPLTMLTSKCKHVLCKQVVWWSDWIKQRRKMLTLFRCYKHTIMQIHADHLNSHTWPPLAAETQIQHTLCLLRCLPSSLLTAPTPANTCCTLIFSALLSNSLCAACSFTSLKWEHACCELSEVHLVNHSWCMRFLNVFCWLLISALMWLIQCCVQFTSTLIIQHFFSYGRLLCSG